MGGTRLEPAARRGRRPPLRRHRRHRDRPSPGTQAGHRGGRRPRPLPRRCRLLVRPTLLVGRRGDRDTRVLADERGLASRLRLPDHEGASPPGGEPRVETVSERDRRRSVAAPTRRRSPARTTTMRSTRATIADELAHLRFDRHGRDRDNANSRECDDPATTALASFSPEKTKAPHAQGFQMVGGTGLEPVTSSLSSWYPHPQRATTRGHQRRQRCGFAGHRASEAAWLRVSVSGRLGHDWPRATRPERPSRQPSSSASRSRRGLGPIGENRDSHGVQGAARPCRRYAHRSAQATRRARGWHRTGGACCVRPSPLP
jgi:hypothetical protein